MRTGRRNRTLDQKMTIVDIIDNGKGTLASKCDLIGISTTTYYNYRKYIRLSQSTNKQSNDTIEHLSNALDDINMEFFGGNLKTITITLGNGRSRNYRRTNGGAR
jgi:ACT domain-containing protein